MTLCGHEGFSARYGSVPFSIGAVVMASLICVHDCRPGNRRVMLSVRSMHDSGGRRSFVKQDFMATPFLSPGMLL